MKFFEMCGKKTMNILSYQFEKFKPIQEAIKPSLQLTNRKIHELLVNSEKLQKLLERLEKRDKKYLFNIGQVIEMENMVFTIHKFRVNLQQTRTNNGTPSSQIHGSTTCIQLI